MDMLFRRWAVGLGFGWVVTAVSSIAFAEDLSLLNRYLGALEQQSIADLPLTDDVTFSGPLLPEPLVGKEAVTSFLNRALPSVELIEIRQQLEGPDGACAELVFYVPNPDVTVEEVHCLTFEGGSVGGIRLYFDPRPLLDGAGN